MLVVYYITYVCCVYVCVQLTERLAPEKLVITDDSNRHSEHEAMVGKAAESRTHTHTHHTHTPHTHTHTPPHTHTHTRTHAHTHTHTPTHARTRIVDLQCACAFAFMIVSMCVSLECVYEGQKMLKKCN